jgi:ribosomal protein S18 acetylase RimI-like enzyme
MTIRKYQAEDWPELCRIHDAARLDELGETPGAAAFLPLADTAESEGLFAANLDVLVEHDRILGFVAYSESELTWLYVAPERYREGTGRKLLRHAIAHSGAVFETQVLVGNEAALALYLAEGFRILARKDGKLEGNDDFPASAYLLRREKSDRSS